MCVCDVCLFVRSAWVWCVFDDVCNCYVLVTGEDWKTAHCLSLVGGRTVDMCKVDLFVTCVMCWFQERTGRRLTACRWWVGGQYSCVRWTCL